jgi:hypothetical protein
MAAIRREAVKPRSDYERMRHWLLHEALRCRVAGDVRGRRQVQKDMVRARATLMTD